MNAVASNNVSDHRTFQRVVVTGVGAVCAAGEGIDNIHLATLSGLRNPKPRPTLFNADFDKPVFECDARFSSGEPGGRSLKLLEFTLREALEHAGLGKRQSDKFKIGVCVGTTVACMLNDLDFYAAVKKGRRPDVVPLQCYVEGDLSAILARQLEARGPVATIANACSSGTEALSAGFHWLRSGLCDIVVAAGADGLNLVPYCGFNSLQVMGDSVCLPFDRRRSGLNLGEGAATIILETAENAAKRGASPLAELRGVGGGSDAYHITGPHPDGRGLEKAVRMAADVAGADLKEIEYINAHGTSTKDNDNVEGRLFHRLFGENVKFASTKYYTGHTLGAAGAIEAALCVKGILERRLPGIPGIEPDPQIPVAPLAENADYNGGVLLSTSMAFGGSCAALIFGPPSTENTPRKTMKTIIPEIGGLGVIGPFGRGVDEFAKALANTKSGAALKTATPRSIPKEQLEHPSLKRVGRRSGKLGRAMLAAAIEAVENAGLATPLGQSTAVVVASAFGAHSATFAFLDGLLEYGHTAPSPTHFSNSVHNSMAFLISSSLGITGPSITVTGFDGPFERAKTLAEAILNSGTIERILLVAGDETNDVFLEMAEIWRGFQGEKHAVWGECAVAFLLGPGDGTPEKHANAKPSPKTLDATLGRTLIQDAFALAAERCDTTTEHKPCPSS